MNEGSVLSARQLNRALLSRQMLLGRENVGPIEAVERLGGMQAQLPRPPFIGLWSRLEGFQNSHLLTVIHSGKVVRATLMRATIHLMSAGDYLTFRTALQPALTAGMQSIQKTRGASIDLPVILKEAARLFAKRPQTFAEVRAALLARFPEADDRMMGYAVRTSLPLIMAPDETDFGFSNSTFALADSLLGRSINPDDRTEDLVLRYLAAFGPATVRDAQAWSGLAKLEPVFERLRPRLITFRDARKKELFDLPDAPRPAEDVAAPPRFLPSFDSAILAHFDRSRIVPAEHRARLASKNLQVPATLLIDGFVAGTWSFAAGKKKAVLTLTPFSPIARKVNAALLTEAEALLRFLAPNSMAFEISIIGA